MFDLSNFAVDRLSFWLGFLAASFFWFLVSRLQKNSPALRKYFKEALAAARERRLAGVAYGLRQEVLNRAQKNHLFSNLCALDEIVVAPQLIAPPAFNDPDSPGAIDTISTQITGYLPDQPDFAAMIHAERLSLTEALTGGANLAIVAHAGRGKSTALAYLAAQIARQSPEADFLAAYFPLYLHVHDFELNPGVQRSALENLIQAVSRHAPFTAIPQVRSYLKNTLENHNAILLLDGYDELCPVEQSLVQEAILTIHADYPKLRMVITSEPGQLGDLVQAGFEPLALSGWNAIEIRNFVQNWARVWNAALGKTVDLSNSADADAIHEWLMLGWLGFDPVFQSPMEWTLRLWGALSGNLDSTFALDAVNTYIQTQLSDPRLINSATVLACMLQRSRLSHIPYSDAEQAINSLNFDFESDSESNEKGPARRKKTSSGAKTLTRLEESRLLTFWPNETISFSSPVWVGYFAALQPNCLPLPPESQYLDANFNEYIRFSIFAEPCEWIEEYLRTDSAPMYPHLLRSLSWMQTVRPNAPIRSSIMRHAAYHLSTNRAPQFIRMHILAAASTSNDPSLAIFFKQLLSSAEDKVRLFGALGCGITQDAKNTKDLVKLLNDPESSVRSAACYALSRIDTGEAQQALTNALMYGDEQLRLTAAEIAAADPQNGHPRLQELLTSPDLLTRRSAVYGLSLIKEAWVVPLLEKMAIEDGQWVVRNAAAQALETLQSPNPRAPHTLSTPADLPWLIAFAAKLGMGISKTESPTAILLTALKSGSPDEQIASLPYVRNYISAEDFNNLFALMDAQSKEVERATHYTLWALQAKGIEMPAVFAF